MLEQCWIGVGTAWSGMGMGAGSQMDGCRGVWVLRTGLGSRLEMDFWMKRVWREDMVFL